MAKATLQSESKDNPPSAKKIIKRISDVFLTVILLTAIITAVYIFQNKKTNGQVQIAGYRLYVVLSGSMSPTFDTGSAVIVRSIDPKDIVTGDIITFMGATNTGKTITHRIIAIDSTGGELSFTTKGDANNTADSSPLYPEDVIGKVQFSIPHIGYFLEFSKTKEGIYFLIILPSIVIILLEARNVFVLLSEKKRKKAMAAKAAKLEGPKTETDAGALRPSEPIKVIEEAIASHSAAEERAFAANPSRTDEPEKWLAPPAQSSVITKKETPTDSAAKIAQDLLFEAQMRSTQKTYQAQVESEKTVQELQHRLDSLYREEGELDRIIRQKTDQIIGRLKQ